MGKNWKNNRAAWNDSASQTSWGSGNAGAATAYAPSGKNWKCEQCNFTTNCPWWWRCGRESCQAEWAPKDDGNEWGNSAAATPPKELIATREKLATLVSILEPGDPTLVKWADKVRLLEEAQKTGVSTAERLRRLLQTQKQLDSKQTSALATMNKAKEDLRKATAALKGRMEECDAVVADIAANTLEIAEVTRSATPAVAPAPAQGEINMVQDMRAQIDILLPSDLEEAGTDLAGVGHWFGMFSKLICLVDRAKTRTEEAPPGGAAPAVEVVAPPPAIIVVAPPPAIIAAAPASSQAPISQPDPVQRPSVSVAPPADTDDDEDDKMELSDKGAAKRELEKAEKLLEDVRVADAVGSSG